MAARFSRLIGRSSGNSDLAAPATERTVHQGDVIGLVTDGGAHSWRAVPYAASTAGPNRWRAPRPAPGWPDRRVAIEFGPRCAQLTNQGDQDEGIEPGLVVGSEDCLTLDIYAPPDTRHRSLPVMVWIHGGGNVWGRSCQYDASNLALSQDVVVVIAQYRVGLLGWFAHPALRESAREPDDAAACFATLDLIAALGWVADNIASFGGDPDCVTIFGESSGGHNVVTLLASPLAAGLFHRAIIQSGVFDSVTLAEAEGRDGNLLNPSAAIAERLGASTADELRAVPVEQLYAACDTENLSGGWFLDVPRVIRDGVALPSTPLLDAFASTDTFNAVPIIMGTTRDEMKLFYAGQDEMTRKRFGSLVIARDQDFYDAKARYLSRLWRIQSIDASAALMAAGGHHDVFAYRFDWDDGGRLLGMDFKQLFGAAHGFDIPFVFGRFEHLGDADRFLFQRRTRKDRERLSRTMGRYWASFARDGKPSCPGQPTWPRYGARDEGSYLLFDTDNDGGVRVVDGADSVERYVHDLRRDRRVDEHQRRLIVEETDRWMFGRPIYDDIKSGVLDEPGPTGPTG